MANFSGSHNSNGGQIHWFSQPNRNDNFNIGLNNFVVNSQGVGSYRHDSHHIYGNGGNDIYNFTDFASLGNFTTGRLDTFDPTRDTIQIEGTAIDLNNLPATVNGIYVSVVEFQGQQWLRMQDGNAKTAIFALEGARLSENVIADNAPINRVDIEERHFVNVSTTFFNSLPAVNYENPMNMVPHHLYAGMTLNQVAGDLSTVNGTSGNDMIFAQKFDGTGDRGSQVINAGNGHDVVQARSGNDTVFGGSGNDSIAGGIDNDMLYGGIGNDVIFGGTERDMLFGEAGRDRLEGGRDNDVISGGAHADTVNGGEGEDIFTFAAGDMVRWNSLTGTAAQRNANIDVIDDFVVGEDLIRFEAGSGVTSLSQLSMWMTNIGGDRHFTISVKATSERILVDVAENVVWADLYSADNFVFGNTTEIVTAADMYAWSALSGTTAQRNAQLNIIEDFDVGTDQIRFTASTGIDEMSDLQAWRTVIGNNTYFTLREVSTNERILVEVDPSTTYAQFFDADNFIFG